MEKRTAIILVTYNGWALTEACLKDLEPLFTPDSAAGENGWGNFVVAIADNGSTDGTIENIRKNYPANKYRNLRVYPQEKNLGFGAANNAAIRGLAADGMEFDAICLLNNDTRLEASAIAQLRRDLDRTTEQGCSAVIVPTTVNADGSRQNNFFAGLGPDGIGSLRFFLNAFRGERGAARILEGTPKPAFITNLSDGHTAGKNIPDFLETHWASAVCWMLSRKLWEAAGGFDEKLFMYYEDADLALRLRKLGGRFFISQESIITHLGGGSAKNKLNRALQHDRSQQYVFRKHFGIRGLLLSKAFRFTRSLVRFLTALPCSFIGKKAREKREYLRHHFALLMEALS